MLDHRVRDLLIVLLEVDWEVLLLGRLSGGVVLRGPVGRGMLFIRRILFLLLDGGGFFEWLFIARVGKGRERGYWALGEYGGFTGLGLC